MPRSIGAWARVAGLLVVVGCGSSDKGTSSIEQGGGGSAAGAETGSGGSAGDRPTGSGGTGGGAVAESGGRNGSGGAAGGSQARGGADSGGGGVGGRATGGSGTGGHATGGRPDTNGGAMTTGGNEAAGTGTGGGATAGSNAGGSDAGGSGVGGSGVGGSGVGGSGVGGSPSSGGEGGMGGDGKGGTNQAGGTSEAGASSGGAMSVGGTGTGGTDETPGVRIVGRAVTGADGTRFEWPGVSIQARFSGTEASMELYDGNDNEFEVIVDGEVKGTILTRSGQTNYPLVSGLAEGIHELVVWRRTEAYLGTSRFVGLSDFGTGGQLLAPPPPKLRRMELIGDSITCGYGNEGSPGCSGTKPENNYLAYGAVAARALDADLHTVAWSGIGMYRNYGEDGPSEGTMPAKYDLALPNDDSSVWDFSQFIPQVVGINLGTNDYSTRGDPGQPYVDAYVSFLSHLREVYPEAYIVCLVQASDLEANIVEAVDARKAAGDSALEVFDISVTEGGSGCDGHPDVAAQAAMGEKLARELVRVTGW